MKRFIAGVAAGGALFCLLPSALAAAGHDHGAAAATADTTLSEGTVKRIDKAAGLVTLVHGPIANLQMPGMTMPFRVADPAWLTRLKAGDKVRFRAEEKDGGLVIVRIEVAK